MALNNRPICLGCAFKARLVKRGSMDRRTIRPRRTVRLNHEAQPTKILGFGRSSLRPAAQPTSQPKARSLLLLIGRTFWLAQLGTVQDSQINTFHPFADQPFGFGFSPSSTSRLPGSRIVPIRAFTSMNSTGPPRLLSSKTPITNRPVYQAKVSRSVRFT
jgi:hypothetical protein